MRASAPRPNHRTGFGAVSPWRTVHHRLPKNAPSQHEARPEHRDEKYEGAHSESLSRWMAFLFLRDPVPGVCAADAQPNRQQNQRPGARAAVLAVYPAA